MKAIKYLSIIALMLFTATSCMNDFDEPKFNEPPFGNNEIGEANTTIAQLKAKYATIISGSSVEEITEDIIIEGVVVAERWNLEIGLVEIVHARCGCKERQCKY